MSENINVTQWQHKHHKSIKVLVVNENLELRLANTRPRRGVLYRRLDDAQQPDAARPYADFMRVFEKVKI